MRSIPRFGRALRAALCGSRSYWMVRDSEASFAVSQAPCPAVRPAGMEKPLSMNHRECLLAAIASGVSGRQAAERFGGEPVEREPPADP